MLRTPTGPPGGSRTPKYVTYSNFIDHFFLKDTYKIKKIPYICAIKKPDNGIRKSDILIYFSDTFDVILMQNETKTFSENFNQTISFLQAIYIQQDFVEELLSIFKCNTNKGDLKKNENYSINRDIRNELVGHPIRKETSFINNQQNEICSSCGRRLNKSKKDLISSTIFSNASSWKKIAYIRYHKNNNYKFEKVEHDKTEIIKRHLEFLDFYLDIIIKKLESVLKKFESKIKVINTVLEKAPFKNIIQITEIFFEYIFKNNALYNPEILIEIERRREEHKRYENGVNIFKRDLKNVLESEKECINEHLLSKYQVKFDCFEKIQIIFTNESAEYSKKVSYDYELSKLNNRDDYQEFESFSSILREKCGNKKNVLLEIEHMDRNFKNDLEFNCAYYYIREMLEEE